MQSSAKFYYIFNSSFTQILGLDGIVLWPFVCISTSRKNTPQHILKHELVHVAQIRREGGPIYFYIKYLYDIFEEWIKTGNLEEAYEASLYEKEAYKKERKNLTKKEQIEIRKYTICSKSYMTYCKISYSPLIWERT